MDKRYQIFISSTFTDLEEERESVMKAILNTNCFPAGMELFPSSSMEQFEYIKTIIDKSDYYVLIIAARYGTVAADGISYTEKEFNYALEKGIPVIAFIKENIMETPLYKADTENDKREKLNKFIEKVKDGRMVNWWSDKNDLANKVSTSLRSEFEIHPRLGWVRGNVEIVNHISDNVRKIRSPETIKDKVLFEIYREYCQDISDMENNITESKLNLDKEVFLSALDKLESEKLIKDVKFANGGGKKLMAFTDNMKITTYGISYLEKKEYI